MTHMPPLETARLRIRPFVLADLDALHQLLDVELSEADFGTEGAQSLDERREWLQWAALNYEQLAKMYQPPYGDRAIELKQTGQLIGAIGYVPCMMPFGQLPAFAADLDEATRRRSTCEFGLYYAMSPAHQRQGYTSEAAAAMVEYAFQNMGLRRVVATTTYDNDGSIGVMRRLGMQIERNPFPDPPWMQVVGFIER
jgi:ribosomal-protein-alanine N-acetyltransferase